MWEEMARGHGVAQLSQIVGQARASRKAAPAANAGSAASAPNVAPAKLTLDEDLLAVGVYTHDEEGLSLQQWRRNNNSGEGSLERGIPNIFHHRCWVPPTTQLLAAQDNLLRSYLHPDLTPLDYDAAEKTSESDEYIPPAPPGPNDPPKIPDEQTTVALPDFFRCCK